MVDLTDGFHCKRHYAEGRGERINNCWCTVTWKQQARIWTTINRWAWLSNLRNGLAFCREWNRDLTSFFLSSPPSGIVSRVKGLDPFFFYCSEKGGTARPLHISLDVHSHTFLKVVGIDQFSKHSSQLHAGVSWCTVTVMWRAVWVRFGLFLCCGLWTLSRMVT